VSALDVKSSSNKIVGVDVTAKTVYQVYDNSTAYVNSSEQCNIWDSLDTPADISAGDLGDGDFGAKNITTSSDMLLASDYSSLYFGNGVDSKLYFNGDNFIIDPNTNSVEGSFLINGEHMTSISTKGLGVYSLKPDSVFMEFQTNSSGSAGNTGEMLMSAKSSSFSAIANMKMGHQINQNSRDSFLSLGVRGETSATAVERFRIIPQNSTFYNDLAVNGSGIFNFNQQDKDFIVSSTGLANMIYVDASTNQVGIGSTPSGYTLHVRGGSATLRTEGAASIGGTLTAQNDFAFGSGFADWLFNIASPTFYRTNGGNTTYPFNGAGHLVIQPRTSTGLSRDIILATGSNIPSPRMVIDTSGNVGISSIDPSYPLEVNASTSDISIWALGNISATGYITRTSVYDKSQGSALDQIKDADELKSNGEINDSKFFGHVTYQVQDTSRPVEESVSCVINETSGEKGTCIEIAYPYNKTEEGVLLDKEIDLLRQAVYELKIENENLKARVSALEKI